MKNTNTDGNGFCGYHTWTITQLRVSIIEVVEKVRFSEYWGGLGEIEQAREMGKRAGDAFKWCERSHDELSRNYRKHLRRGDEIRKARHERTAVLGGIGANL